MKQFLKYMLATIVGIIITSFLGIFIFFGIIGIVASQAGGNEKVVELKPHSVYQIDLKGTLVDRSEDDPMAFLSLAFNQPVDAKIGLDDVLANIEKAKNDDRIEGIFLNGGMLMGGQASIKEIRDALIDFKKTKKFIVAYADNYLQSNYYLASVADKILINPSGILELKGLSAELLFIKKTLDKIGVEMQVVKVGTFKSAVEPYINTEMSDANRKQVSVYMNSIWKTMLDGISQGRNIPVDTLNTYADEMLMFSPVEKLKAYALVDSVVYADEVDSIINTYTKDFSIINHAEMCKLSDNKPYHNEKIAVLYAAGAIDNGGTEGISSEKLIKTIDKLSENKSVKAVVFRVSSPGGSAYGSEQIWRALTRLKEQKPLVVSMGDYAASGGYYIACMADYIMAQPNTITGSIGIFGLIPNISGLNEKLGLTYDGVKTNKMSDAISINRPFRAEERELMQAYVNRGYELFVKRCADGRKKTTDQIKEIAEGRVWTGEDALRIGLVDSIGGMDEAIAKAASLAKVTSYQVKDYPEKEDFTTRLLKSFGQDMEARFARIYLGEQYKLFHYIKNIEKINGIQARLPYELVIK